MVDSVTVDILSKVQKGIRRHARFLFLLLMKMGGTVKLCLAVEIAD